MRQAVHPGATRERMRQVVQAAQMLARELTLRWWKERLSAQRKNARIHGTDHFVFGNEARSEAAIGTDLPVVPQDKIMIGRNFEYLRVVAAPISICIENDMVRPTG